MSARRYPDLPGYGLDTYPEKADERWAREQEARELAERRADYEYDRRKDEGEA